jgi:ribosomal protein L7/L12
VCFCGSERPLLWAVPKKVRSNKAAAHKDTLHSPQIYQLKLIQGNKKRHTHTMALQTLSSIATRLNTLQPKRNALMVMSTMSSKLLRVPTTSSSCSDREVSCFTTISTTTTSSTAITPTINCTTKALYHTTSRSCASPKVDEVFNKILQLDLFEVHILTELVNEKMGLKPMTDAQRAAMSGGGAAMSGGKSSETEAGAVEEKKTLFDLKLTGYDAKAKIKVIKEIRAITGLGLKEAKELVEGVPKSVKKDIKMDEAESIKKILEGVGATVEIS